MILSSTIRGYVGKFVKQEAAVTAIEYALIAALIAAVIIGVVTTLGTTIKGVFTTITNAL